MKRITYLLVLSLLIGCGGGGGEGGGDPKKQSVAPVISGLNYVPVSATVNEGRGDAYIRGVINFVDPEGDVVELWLSTSNGGSQVIYLPSVGATTGSIEGLFYVPTAQVGSFDFNVWVVDGHGNKSNVLSGKFTITQDLDTSFGQGGIVIDDDALSGFNEEAIGVVLQTDGKIVVAVSAFNGLSDDVLIKRYNADGSPDTNFAASGTFTFDSGGPEVANAVAMQLDGKIVVVGTIHHNVLVMRLNSDGTLDNTFGTNGVAITDFSNYGENGYAVAIQSDGKLVIAGDIGIGGTDSQALLLRYNRNGTLDSTFGTNGFVTYDGIGWTIAYGVSIQQDNKIVVTGNTSETSSTLALTDLLVLRYNSDGTVDTAFGTNGVVTYNSIYESGRAVLVQNDGRIVVGGTRWDYASINDAALIIRLNSDGTLDSAFGQDGVFIYKKEYGFPSIAGKALAMSSDGKIVLVGFINTDLLVIRVTSDGSYDTTFSADGISYVSSGGYAKGSGVVLQSDGSIIAVGNSTFHDQYSDEAVFLSKLTGH